jgi:cytochrome c
MSGDQSEQGEAGAHKETRVVRARASTLEHEGMHGAQPSNSSPLRWVLVIVPLMLVILGGLYLAGLWTASLQRAPEQRRAKEQRPVAPQQGVRRAPTESSGVDARDSEFDIGVVLGLLPKADPKEGATVFKMCAVCHTDERNGPHKVGSNLWNIVGSPKAALPGFAYSQALRAKGGTWSYRELAQYLHNPRTSVQGTSMAFAGIRNNERMANLLAYMRMRADKPAPLPK